MKENKKLLFGFLIIVIIVIISIFFITKGNKNTNISNGKTSTSQQFEDLTFKLPTGYRTLIEDSNSISYGSDNYIYISINTRQLNNKSVLEFLKDVNFPEDKINEKTINNSTWYNVTYSEFGDRFYYYTSEKDGILYELKIYASEKDDKSILEKDVNSLVKTLNFIN